MLIVCLNYLMRSCIILRFVSSLLRAAASPHLYDLLVLHSRQKDVLFIWIWMVFDHVGDLTIREGLDAFSAFSIPDLDMSIIRS